MVLIDPQEVEDLVVGELSGSALFGARFRENAGRALLIPRAYPGRRTPLWQQRLKSQSLLEVAAKYGEFPIVLETFRECLRDVFDLPALVKLLTQLSAARSRWWRWRPPVASPMASSLLFDYVATYMYEGDTPNAERRAAALSLDRDLLRELLGQEELRDLIDAGALAAVEADLQWLSEQRRVATRDQLHDMLRALGDLNETELAARVDAGSRAGADARGAARRAPRDQGPARRRAALDRRGRRRDLPRCARRGAARRPAGGVPGGRARRADAGGRGATRRRTVRSTGPSCASATASTAAPVLAALERDGDLVQGELRPGGSGREWCHREVLRRLRRASLAALRKEVEPVEASALARFLPSWQGVDRHPPPAPASIACVTCWCRCRVSRCRVEIWEREVLPRRTGAYSPAWMDQLCASGELVWIGAGALGRSGRVALYFREEVPLLGAPPAGEPPGGPRCTRRCASGSARGAAFFTDLLVDVGAEIWPTELQEALWDLVWAGEVTNDAFAPLRAPRLTVARDQAVDGPARPAAVEAGMPGAGGRHRLRFRAAGR